MGRHIATQIRELETQVEQEIARRAAALAVNSQDRSPWAWYDESCPCNLPPGECKIHPRARSNQRPPTDPWTQFCFLAGRGSGKSYSGAQWARNKAETYPGCSIALVAPTAADARDVMVLGPSGLLSICPPYNRPKYQPSLRRLVWPNGSTAMTFSAEEPDRLRGPQNHFAWADEVAAWFDGEKTYDNLMMGLRLGQDPQVFLSTTPRPTRFIKKLVADPVTVVSRGTTYDNAAHLPAAFFNTIISRYQGTRLGAQELMAEILETTDGAWFANFDPAKHVSLSAEYDRRLPACLGIDAGTSRHTGAVFFQGERLDGYRVRITAFAEYLAKDKYSQENARAIKAHGETMPCQGRLDLVRIDPASVAKTSIGPAAYEEYEKVFGSRKLAKAPGGIVADTLDLMECLLDQQLLIIHPRCTHLIDAFRNYRRLERGGELTNESAPDQSPCEDMMDAFRYGIRSVLPGGLEAPTRLITGHVSNFW